MSQVRCKKCDCSFEPNSIQYCAEDFCPDCREEPANDVVAARKESYTAFRNMGHNKAEADRRAQAYARQVERERAKRGQ